MYEIKCPKCNEVFKVDESGYNEIVTQIRNKEFEKEIAEVAGEIADFIQKLRNR